MLGWLVAEAPQAKKILLSKMVLLLIFSTMKLVSSRSEIISGLSAGLSSLLNEVSGYTIFNNVARGRCLLLARLVSGDSLVLTRSRAQGMACVRLSVNAHIPWLCVMV